MRIFAVAAVLALLAVPAQAGSCLQYDTNAEFGSPSGNLNTYKYCDCVMNRIRSSSTLSNEQKAGMALGYTENVYKATGIDVEAVRAGRVVLTDRQKSQVNEVENILADCNPQNNE